MARRNQSKDPYQQRESGRYEDPIASREAILSALSVYGKPADLKTIASQCDTPKRLHHALDRRLSAMVRDGQLLYSRRKRYAVVSSLRLIKGSVVMHKQGFGFIDMPCGRSVFLAPRQLRGVMPQDVLLVRVGKEDAGGRLNGVLVDVLQRTLHHVVGRYREKAGVGLVDPLDKRIPGPVLIPKQSTWQDGDGVVVAVTPSDTSKRDAILEGEVACYLGQCDDIASHYRLATYRFQLPHQWSDAVQAEAASFSDTHRAHRASDLTHLPFVTVDGVDAQDFDDAIYVERIEDGFKLWVAIADVSLFVTPGSALDKEAYQRGTSVYFPGHVIPMLPERLSNDLCSLKPQVVRQALVCCMTLNAAGEVIDRTFQRARIQSHQRFTYDELEGMRLGKQAIPDFWQPVFDAWQAMFNCLQAKRMAQGCLQLVMPESRVMIAADQVTHVETALPCEAHQWIEVCMVLANVQAAFFLQSHDQTVLYRIHPSPSEERLHSLIQTCVALDLIKQKDARGIEGLAGLMAILPAPLPYVVQQKILRTLAQASYHPDNVGHFGLAEAHYCHFTSPIRRYADLLVHRSIVAVIDKQSVAKRDWYDTGEHLSTLSRRADLASWAVQDGLKALWMKAYIGESFQGAIISVHSFGVFIRLLTSGVEGLVHVSSLPDDYYTFHEAQSRLVGEQPKHCFALGDTLHVRLLSVDTLTGKIDFEYLGDVHEAC